MTKGVTTDGAGDRLDALRELRARADYDTSASIREEESKVALELADRIRFLLGPDWGQFSRT